MVIVRENLRVRTPMNMPRAAEFLPCVRAASGKDHRRDSRAIRDAFQLSPRAGRTRCRVIHNAVMRMSDPSCACVRSGPRGPHIRWRILSIRRRPVSVSTPRPAVEWCWSTKQFGDILSDLASTRVGPCGLANHCTETCWLRPTRLGPRRSRAVSGQFRLKSVLCDAVEHLAIGVRKGDHARYALADRDSHRRS